MTHNRIDPAPDDRSDVLTTGALLRGHTFLIFWRPSNPADALRALGRWAARPDVPFSWQDAAALSVSIQHAVQGKAEPCSGFDALKQALR